MVDGAVEVYGRLDCAFNNAGGGAGGGPLHEVLEEAWDRAIDVNLKGTWLSMKYEIRQMLKQRGGAIVNDSSVAGLTGWSLATPYAAAKHGVVGLTKSAALQYAKDGIRINAVCPGFVLTPQVDTLFTRRPQVGEWVMTTTPMERCASPDEIAEAVLWLCSDAASYVTGLTMPIYGGISAGFKPE